MTAPPALQIRSIGGRLGAEVRGLIPGAIQSSTATRLRQALIEHQVLFLPGLAPSLLALRDIGALFGPLEVHPYIPKADPGVPEVCELDTSKLPKADVWHTDVTFSESPPVAGILHMIESPEVGGDTMWISCQDVFDSLSPALQEFLSHLTCIHEDAGQAGRKAEHPVVRVHPDTGRRSLYVNKQFSRRIPQLSRPESQALLGFLFRWQEQIKFSCRHRWTPGDVALWDERVTLHAIVDDTSARRVLRRVTVLGDTPLSPEGVETWPPYQEEHTASSGFYGLGGYEF